jgi:mannitol 2-dehydrogenase
LQPLCAALFQKIGLQEIVPYVAAVPDMTPTAYVDMITGRVANSEIRGTTRRVAFDGASRHVGFQSLVLQDAQG